MPQNFKNNVMRREREPDSIITNVHQNQMFFKNKYRPLKDICQLQIPNLCILYNKYLLSQNQITPAKNIFYCQISNLKDTFQQKIFAINLIQPHTFNKNHTLLGV